MNAYRHARLALWISVLFVSTALTLDVRAAGFGTPAVDGMVDAVYGAPEATDPVDAPQGNAPMDLGDLFVCNDNAYWYFLFTVHEDIASANWGKYLLLIDTTNDSTGATSDPWGRSVVVDDAHLVEYSARTWLDNPPYGASDTQFWEWTGAAWSGVGAVDGAALSAGSPSGIEWKISRSRLGDPAEIWVEVASTGGGMTDPAQDTANDPPDDWNAVNWADTSFVMCSTHVPLQTGSDTIPPTVLSARVPDGAPTSLVVSFSEALDAVTAEDAANYALSGGVTVSGAALTGDSTGVTLALDAAFGFGSCESVTVSGVKDLANNTVVEDGSGNVASFMRFRLHVRGHMSQYLVSFSSPPDTFAIEGGVAPLSWSPTCDHLLLDADGDSVYTADVDFSMDCVTPVDLEYKFTHNCATWESIGNHFYTIDPATGTDTLDIWWNDEAPVDFTGVDIDVLFFVQSPNGDPPFGAADTLAINGSALPLTWTVPSTTLFADDGVLPDSVAGDGVFSRRLTFPAGTLKSVEFKYLLGGVYECDPGPNRNVFLDDSIFSTENPIILPVHYFGDCTGVTGADIPASARGNFLSKGCPNPSRGSVQIDYGVAREGDVRLSVFDVRGRRVSVLVDGQRPRGASRVIWNGTDGFGRRLPAGLYFYRIEMDGFCETRKIVLIP